MIDLPEQFLDANANFLALRLQRPVLRFEAFDLTGAYAASVVLALLAIATLASMTLLRRRGAPA